MFRTVLVALKPAESQRDLVEYAATQAANYHWEVIGLSVVDTDRLAPPEAVPLGGAAFKHQRDEERIAAARQASSDVCLALETACLSKSVRCTTYQRDGDIVQALAHHAHAADVLLCGHTPGGDASEQSLLASILKRNFRPAIVFPQTKYSGESILVAFDGSVQASRTLASFVASGLAEKRAVQVVSFHEDLAQAQALAAAAGQFLDRHGISASTQGSVLKLDPARHILEEVSRANAGLIVMGAFGKHVLREFIFGSVTRTILASLPVPLFLDH